MKSSAGGGGGHGAAAIYLFRNWLAIRVITPNAIQQNIAKGSSKHFLCGNSK
jgi:hypothetical protein